MPLCITFNFEKKKCIRNQIFFLTFFEKMKSALISKSSKLRSKIKAEKSGTLKQILVENGQPIEFDQELFVIE